jgi:hypothetical protein
MKTMKVTENLELSLHDDSQQYDVKIDNSIKKVIYHSSEYSPITLERIQKLVDKLIHLKMITLVGGITDVTEVSICIWSIDDTDDLYIETYHMCSDELFDDYNVSMKYDDFLEQ